MGDGEEHLALGGVVPVDHDDVGTLGCLELWLDVYGEGWMWMVKVEDRKRSLEGRREFMKGVDLIPIQVRLYAQ